MRDEVGVCVCVWGGGGASGGGMLYCTLLYSSKYCAVNLYKYVTCMSVVYCGTARTILVVCVALRVAL